jgi:phosphate transport system permease protein
MIIFSLLALLLLFAASYFYGYQKSQKFMRSEKLVSRPYYHGSYVLTHSLIFALIFILCWLLAKDYFFQELIMLKIKNELAITNPEMIATYYHELVLAIQTQGAPAFLELNDLIPFVQKQYALFSYLTPILLICGALLGSSLAYFRLSPQFKAREKTEKWLKLFFLICSTSAILVTIGIVSSLLFESLLFFQKIPLTSFLFGTHWSPQTATGPYGEDIISSYGILPVFFGTFLISAIAMVIAVPIGLMSAIFIAEYLPKNLRLIFKPLLEVLAGIPTIVYGFFAALIIAPLIHELGTFFGLQISTESALAAGLVMGIMIIPYVSSMTDDAIKAIPQALRDASLGLGATKSETIKYVVLPSALPGIAGGIILALSRAIGETMIVVMAAGMTARLTLNPFESVTTVTVQIASLMVGDQEFDSAKTLSAFALGLVLFIVTLLLNILSLYVVRKYQQKFD